jgi:hypothetical protein
MNTSPTVPSLQFQPEKRLQSGDRILILTDVYTEWRSYRSDSTPQKWHRVGCYDLKTQKIGYFLFSVDDARGLLFAGFTPPPWPSGLSRAFEVKRRAHTGVREGRFKLAITTLDIPNEVASLIPQARRMFARDGHWPNSTLGMWGKLAGRVAQEQAIERAALAQVGWFKAGDIKKVVGNVNVSPVLTRLVEEERLVSEGKKRGARYMVAPPTPLPNRADWVG